MEMLPLTQSSPIEAHDWFQFIGLVGAGVGFWQVMRAIRKEKDSDIVFRTQTSERLKYLEKQPDSDRDTKFWLVPLWAIAAMMFLVVAWVGGGKK